MTGNAFYGEAVHSLLFFLQQYVLHVVLEKLMKLIRGDGFVPEEETSLLSVHDEQVLQYVVGYIPYALL